VNTPMWNKGRKARTSSSGLRAKSIRENKKGGMGRRITRQKAGQFGTKTSAIGSLEISFEGKGTKKAKRSKKS